MGLANWGRAGEASRPVSRRAAGGLTALLAGVAATALFAASAHAQQAAQANGQQTEQEKQDAEAKKASGTTLLDRIMLASRIGESAIESLSSSSHVDREQIERRMAATPNEMLFGVPGVAVQADSRRVASSINIRGLQDFGRVAVIVDLSLIHI